MKTQQQQQTTIDYKPLKKYFSKESNWCRHAFAKDSNGDVITGGIRESVNNPKTVKRCLLGSIVYLYEDDRVVDKIEKRIKSVIKRSIIDFNDNSSFEKVQDMVNKLPDKE